MAALLPVFVAAQLAQQGLQSVWVPYTTYRYGWSVTDVGISLAIVGLLGAYPRPDTPHLAYTIPLAAPLFALVATDLLGRLRRL